MDPGSFVVNASENSDLSKQTSETGVPPPAPAQEGEFGPRFAHLAKKERELQKKAEEWKREKEGYQSHLKELEELKQWKAQREKEPGDIGEILSKHDLDFSKVTDYYLQGGKPSPEAMIERAKKELEERFDSFEKQRLEKEAKEAETKQQEQLTAFKNQISRFAVDNDYELIAANSAEDTVFAVMDEHFQKEGRIMDTKEACDLVEDYLLTQEVEKLSKIKKLRAKLGFADLEQEPTSAEPSARELESPRTLTTRMTQSGEPKKSPMKSKEELTREAAKLLKFY